MSEIYIEITDEIQNDIAWANNFEYTEPTEAIQAMIARHSKDLVTSTYRPYNIERIEHWAKVLIIQERMDLTKKGWI